VGRIARASLVGHTGLSQHRSSAEVTGEVPVSPRAARPGEIHATIDRRPQHGSARPATPTSGRPRAPTGGSFCRQIGLMARITS